MYTLTETNRNWRNATVDTSSNQWARGWGWGWIERGDLKKWGLWTDSKQKENWSWPQLFPARNLGKNSKQMENCGVKCRSSQQGFRLQTGQQRPRAHYQQLPVWTKWANHSTWRLPTGIGEGIPMWNGKLKQGVGTLGFRTIRQLQPDPLIPRLQSRLDWQFNPKEKGAQTKRDIAMAMRNKKTVTSKWGSWAQWIVSHCTWKLSEGCFSWTLPPIW